jgi:hypothetical protein
MNVLAEGLIGQELPMREILKRILLMKAPGVCFLQVTNADGRVTGRVRVIDSTHITGALLASSPSEGYPALKTLLEVKDGTYALFAGRQSDREDGQQALNIELAKLIDNLDKLPEIPASVTSPFDQSAMLDRIFSGEQPEGGASAVQSPQDMQSILGKVVVGEEPHGKRDPGWSTVEPLIADGGNGQTLPEEDAEIGNGDSRKSERKALHTEETKQVTAKIRSLRNDKKVESQRLMRLLLTTVVGVTFIVGGICGVVWMLRSAQAPVGIESSAPVPDQNSAQAASQEEPVTPAKAAPAAKVSVRESGYGKKRPPR